MNIQHKLFQQSIKHWRLFRWFFAVMSISMSAILWNPLNTWLITTWTLCFLCFTLYQPKHWINSPTKKHQIPSQLKTIHFFAFLWACLLGSISLIFFKENAFITHLALFLFLFFSVFILSIVLIGSQSVFLISIIPIQTPFALQLITSLQELDLILLYGMLIYNLLLYFLFNHLSHQLISSLETKKHSQELLRDKANILTAVSHDLRQPLLAQGLFIEELNDIIDDEKVLKLVHFLERSNRSLHNLVSSILEISQLDTCKVKSNVQHITMKVLLDEIEQEYIPRMKQKKLDFEVIHIETVIFSDPELLRRILRNILNNAMQYTLQGKITLKCSITFKFVLIEIIDTGIGIPKHKLKEIFTEFYQIDHSAKYSGGGLGLGLSIVERLAKLLNHPIKIESTQGEGTMFSIMIPYGVPYVRVGQ
ncbi:MAG: HAMP domain-containing histidine kinase [Methylococcales bacterium]|jgi:signal transduction histidine kinase|nr:HAMP domain-containing histidine kinase [Methylococcales bacterium]